MDPITGTAQKYQLKKLRWQSTEYILWNFQAQLLVVTHFIQIISDMGIWKRNKIVFAICMKQTLNSDFTLYHLMQGTQKSWEKNND